MANYYSLTKEPRQEASIDMEGFLPLVYKAIKKRKTRRQYQCLSSGAALSYNMNVAEFYPQTHDHGHGYNYMQEPSTSMQKVVDHDDDDTENIGYMRYNSVREFSSPHHQQRTCVAHDSPDSKQLDRFGSQKIFSCLAG